MNISRISQHTLLAYPFPQYPTPLLHNHCSKSASIRLDIQRVIDVKAEAA
jgi:hypothetical protein